MFTRAPECAYTIELARGCRVGGRRNRGGITATDLVVLSKKGICHSVGTGTSSTADAVDIVLDGEGEGDVEDELDGRNVQTSGGDVRGDEQRALSGLELAQCLRALRLAEIAMYAGNPAALRPQEAFDPGSLLLVQAEYEDPVVFVGTGLVLLD